jgi:hypothetical protein
MRVLVTLLLQLGRNPAPFVGTAVKVGSEASVTCALINSKTITSFQH